MDAPMSSAAAEKSAPADMEAQVEVEAETSKSVDQKIPKRPSQIEVDAQRIRSSVERLTSNSIEGLEGLSSELQELQEFLKSEVARVQSEIESAMAGIKISTANFGGDPKPPSGFFTPSSSSRTSLLKRQPDSEQFRTFKDER
jgi:hypothetical protein